MCLEGGNHVAAQRKLKRVNPDKINSDDKERKQMELNKRLAYPFVVGIFLTRFGFFTVFLDLLTTGGWSDSDSAACFLDGPASVLAGIEGGAHEIGIGSRGSKILQSSSSSSETQKTGV